MNTGEELAGLVVATLVNDHSGARRVNRLLERFRRAEMPSESERREQTGNEILVNVVGERLPIVHTPRANEELYGLLWQSFVGAVDWSAVAGLLFDRIDDEKCGECGAMVPAVGSLVNVAHAESCSLNSFNVKW